MNGIPYACLGLFSAGGPLLWTAGTPRVGMECTRGREYILILHALQLWEAGLYQQLAPQLPAGNAS